MEQSSIQLQARLMREYYKDFSKYARGRLPSRKVAWVTAFTPVEILEALDIEYIYPESYAAVIAASGKEQDMLRESEQRFLCSDCCTYSCCFEGSLSLQTGPRGLPPMPDVLIATNNQCNTLPTWWNMIARQNGIPLIVLDYPGERAEREEALAYVTRQHQHLIACMEQLSGNVLHMEKLNEVLHHSEESVDAWNRVVNLLSVHEISPTLLFDGISHLITSRCRPETSRLYRAMAQELVQLPEADGNSIPLFWLGYPLWYHRQRYLAELLKGCRICGSNYITWWSLDYSGEDPMEQLFQAYNHTFLNLTPETKRVRLNECIRRSGAVGAICLHNKSCKCDFVSSKHVEVPHVELEIDMIDRTFLNLERARGQMQALLEIVRADR